MDAYDRVRASSACKNNVKAHLDKRRPDKKHGTSLPCVDESLLLHRVVWMCFTLSYPSLPFSEIQIEEGVTHAAHSARLSVFDGKGRCKNTTGFIQVFPLMPRPRPVCSLLPRRRSMHFGYKLTAVLRVLYCQSLIPELCLKPRR